MTEGSNPHSQTPSPSRERKMLCKKAKTTNGYKDANEDDPSRETELFEDTLVLNSPFTETEFENHNLETEIVEDSEPAQDMTTGTMCEYGQVVLDSEDEEMNDRDVGKRFLEDETSPTVKIPSTLFQKRRSLPPCEQEDPNAPTFGKSDADHNMLEGDKGALVVADSFDDDNHLYLPAMPVHSPEPEDSTQAALGFVDQYLSSNDVDLFQEIHCRKTTPREKSPRVLSARGPLNLAKKIKVQTQNEEKEPFKWVDESCQNDTKGGMFGKKIEASSNFGRYKLTYTRRRHKKGGHLQSQGNCSASNRCDEKLGRGPRMATENNNSLEELDVQTSAVRENLNVYSSVSVTHVEDMSAIGLDTQIAAEAMDALAFMPPSGFHFNGTHQPEIALDESLRDLTENEAHPKNYSYNQNPSVHSITIKSCDEKLDQGPSMATENNNSRKELDVQSSAVRENVNVYSSVTHVEDVFDIGLDTQIAAEAMDALAFMPPSGCHFNDTHQPKNALDGSLSDLRENEAHLKNSSYNQNSGVHSITIKSCDEKLDQGPRRATENNNSLKELDVQSSAVRENVNIYSSATHVEDMSDIGLDTQIAAEAMDALAFMPHSGCHFNDTHQPKNALDGSLSDLRENEAHLKNSSYNQNSGVHSITTKSCDEKLDQGPRRATENNNSLKELDVQSSAVRENVNVYSSVTHVEDMCDIGLDTQIAAEAMDALAFMPPSDCHFNDTHQPENALDGSLSDLTENEAHLKNSSYNQNPGLHSITKSNKKNGFSCRFSKITSSSSCKHTDKQEQNPVSGEMKKIMKSKSSAEGHFKNNTTLPICSKHVSLEEVCLLGDYISFQSAAEEPKNWNNESRQTRIKDQPSHHTGRNNNVKEKVTIRHKGKRNGFVADPVKLGVRTKRLKLPTNSCAVASKSGLNHQAQVIQQLPATSSFSRTDSWVYPKRLRGKRKGTSVRINLDAPTVLCIDGKENNVFSTRSLEDRANVDKSCFPHTRPLCNASSVVDGRCLLQGKFVKPDSAGDAMKVDNLCDTHPLLLAHVETSSSVARSRSEIPDTVASKGVKVLNANHTSYIKHHRKPRDKTPAKTSLLKEFTRLGVPESTSDMMWKDLRLRRDMTDVRVLFSQHLDDSIIKQQKKILARFNISVASSSMEATHFIADEFTRTKNMLETMALGKLVVNHLWLESCGQANCFIDEKNYILRDMKKEKEIGFSMPVSLAQARQKPLLKGKRVYITPHVKPDKEVIASLVTAVHGQVVDESQVCAKMNGTILDDLLILSSGDDEAICHRFLERGTAVYSSELVLNGIVIQKLEFERHQLFTNKVTRNNPSASNRFGKVYRRR